MADAPFRRARRGDPLNGYPSEVYNAVLDLLGSRLDAPAAYRPYTSTEPGVLNSSGAALATRFQVLKVADPATTQAQNDSEFAESRIMVGTAPAAGSAFVVVQEPLSSNVIGRSTLLGLTPVKVNLTDAGHRYADATNNDPSKLTSAAAGPARILWTESNFAVGDNKWAVVELLGPGFGATFGASGSGTAVAGGGPLAQGTGLTLTAAGTYFIGGQITADATAALAFSVAVNLSLTGAGTASFVAGGLTPAPYIWPPLENKRYGHTTIGYFVQVATAPVDLTLTAVIPTGGNIGWNLWAVKLN